MSELKPCPFCGSADIRTEPGINLNYCDKCSAEANIEHWNTRPIEDALNARIAELETENAALKAEISKLKAPQGWIDVKKQMPDVPIALVAWKDGSIKLDSTFTDGGRDYWYHSGLDNVAYWMPIPEPPEVKE